MCEARSLNTAMKDAGKWFEFDGFVNFHEFIAKEFHVPKGKWKISKVSRPGAGVEVTSGEVRIWGDEYYNYATILQLAREREGYLPEIKIDGGPTFSFRGYHLDIARGGVPTVETFKRILRWLFVLRYNHFAIYFEDLFPWKKDPDIGKHRGRLSDEELSEVVEYGKKLGIEVFPSLELAGHMEHILSLPEYRKYSEWYRPEEGCLDVSDEEAAKFSYDLLQEVLLRSPSRHIHIGGDETWAMGRGKSLDKTWEFRGTDLYMTHHKKMVDLVKQSGKIPVLWGDMLTGMYLGGERERSKWAEVAKSDIWEGAVIANWDYAMRDVKDFRDKINLFGKRKSQQVVCPGFANWHRYYPNFEMATGNIANFIEAAKEERLLGYLVTAWGDDGEECLFSFLEPLLVACAEASEGNRGWEDKWIMLSGESKEVLKARKLFGKPEVSEQIKHVLFADFQYYRMSEAERKSLAESWREILDELCCVNLPEDLEFIRKCLHAGMRRISGEIVPSDLISLANSYARLWLGERKPEGLERILERFWGAAGRVDSKVR